MTTSNTGPICIDLNALESQTTLKEDELIQRQVYQDLKKRVALRLDRITELNKNINSENLPSGLGWVSFIDGTRGAGKTTFLHNALLLLAEESSVKSKLAIMPVIDPSRIEANEIILLILLQAINERVEQAIHAPPESDHKRGQNEQWKKAFKQVAGGLVLFQKDHHPLSELDADLFLDLGLERAGHSAQLRQHLHQLFDLACQLLKVNALLFAFDDADTNARHALALLETIRKYLDTPRLMIKVTGDLELYTLLVRQNFRNDLTQGQRSEWDNDNQGDKQRTQQKIRMLDHLEEQYLLKLFPIRERHHLLPIWKLVNRNDSPGEKQLFTLKINNQENRLLEFVNEKVKKGFRLARQADVNLYSEFLLMQPVRSVLQVLSRIQRDDSPADNSPFHMVMLDLSLHSLYHYNVTAEEIAASDFRALCEASFDVAMNDGDPDTSAYLRPTGAMPHNRAAMFGLSAAVAAQLKGKPGTSLAYLLRVPGMVKLAHVASDFNSRNLSAEVLHSEFKRHMGVGRLDDALGWARLATVTLVAPHAGSPRARVIRHGVVGLNQSSVKKFDRFIGVGDKVFPPAAAFGMVNSSINGLRTFVSIWNILGLMSRLLQMAENPDWTNLKDKSDAIQQILEGMYPNTNTVSAPPWLGDDRTIVVDEESDKGLQMNAKEHEVEHEHLSEKLLDWLKGCEDLIPKVQPSSVMLGKVWVRLFNGLEAISDDCRPNFSGDRYIGFATLMELFALCTVNAFLVEESIHHQANREADTAYSPALSLKNPRTSPDHYLKQFQNLDETHLSKEVIPLTHIIARCPLIQGLIQRNSENPSFRERFSELFEVQEPEILQLDNRSMDALNHFLIQGPKPEKSEPEKKLTIKRIRIPRPSPDDEP